jgi:hypothetical protein
VKPDQLSLTGKASWQMTADEFISHLGIRAGAAAIQSAHNRHSELVYEAIRQGHIPPTEVLQEYPNAARLCRKANPK